MLASKNKDKPREIKEELSPLRSSYLKFFLLFLKTCFAFLPLTLTVMWFVGQEIAYLFISIVFFPLQFFFALIFYFLHWFSLVFCLYLPPEYSFFPSFVKLVSHSFLPMFFAVFSITIWILAFIFLSLSFRFSHIYRRIFSFFLNCIFFFDTRSYKKYLHLNINSYLVNEFRLIQCLFINRIIPGKFHIKMQIIIVSTYGSIFIKDEFCLALL